MIQDFDWRAPDYAAVFRRRIEVLQSIRQQPEALAALRVYYRDHPADFISDWGCTVDPRNADLDQPTVIPFVLFPRQVECVDFIMRKWRAREPGGIEKSRDMGVSWITVALSCTLCIFRPGLAIGFGSRKEEYVDKIGLPRSLFYKARLFMRSLPEEFRAGWVEGRDAPHMRVLFPGTGSVMSGEAGDNIGRGDRASVYFVDESAYLEHPEMIDAALSQTTNCRIDVSSVNGRANPFAQKRFSGKVEFFIFDWRQDPRKDAAWYEKQVSELDPIVVAQEIDRDYSASVEGVVIPGKWVDAALDAHLRLGVSVSGERHATLDLADQGRDKNAFISGQGILIDRIEQWSGSGSDTFYTAERAFELADAEECHSLRYDSDGLGAFFRGDARVINERRRAQGVEVLDVEAFRGSEAVVDPEGEDVKGRKNADYFLNRKAQAWWSLRRRFQNTYRAVAEGHPYDPNEIVSISSRCPLQTQLRTELTQPTYKINAVGKMTIDKTPDGVASPNLADGVMMHFSGPSARVVRVSAAILSNPRLRAAPRRPVRAL